MPASTSPPQQQIIRSPRSGSPSQETHPVASTSAHTLEHQPPPLPEPEPSSIAAQSEGSAAQIKQEAADLTTQALAGSAIGAKAEARAGAGAGAGAEAPGAQPQLNEEDARLLASLATSGGFFADLAQLSASAGTGIGLGGELKSENGVNPFEGDGKQEMGSALGWPQVAGSSEASLAAPGLRTGANLSEAMDVDTRDDGTSEISEREDAGAAQGPIQAYAKLEFPGFSYYIQTLDVSIGRRAANAETGTASVRAAGVDVDLGPLKSISRMHARIFYDPAPALQPAHPDPSFASASASGRGSPAPYARYGSPSFARASPDGLHGNSAAANGSSFGEGRFVLQVLGRNGAFVDDVFVGTAGIVPLGKRTKIQIAERVFYFVLPPPLYPSLGSPGDAHTDKLDGAMESDSLSASDSDENSGSGSASGSASDADSLSDLTPSSSEGSSEEEEESDEEHVQASSSLSEMSEIEEEEEEEAGAQPAPSRPKLVLKSRTKERQPNGEPNVPARAGKGPIKGKRPGKGLKGPGKGLGKSRGPPVDSDVEMQEGFSASDSDDDTPLAARKGSVSSARPSSQKHTSDGKIKASKKSTAESSKRPAKSVKAPPESPSPTKKAKAAAMTAPAWTSGVGIAGRKRKRGDPLAEEEREPALRVGTPIGIEALEAQRRSKAAKGKGKDKGKAPVASDSTSPTKIQFDRDEAAATAKSAAGVEVSAEAKVDAETPVAVPGRGGKGKGRGKGGHGKGPSKSGAEVPIAPAPPSAKNATSGSSADGTSASVSVPDSRPAPATGASTSAAASASSKPASTATTSAPSTVPAPAPTAGPPPGPNDKPALSNIALVTAALSSPECAARGGKLTLQEVYERIMARWPWFRANGRANGRDWQSSVRHAIATCREFTKIPRRPDEPGKGVFYALKDSEAARNYRNSPAPTIPSSSAPLALPGAGQQIPRPLHLPSKLGMGTFNATSQGAGPSRMVNGAMSLPARPPVPTPSSAAARPPAAPGASLPKAGAPSSTLAAAAASSTSASAISAASNTNRITIVIGTAPGSAGAPNPKASNAPAGSIEALLAIPPIVHHEGKLFLSPPVFGHLSPAQLAHIEGLGAQKALEVLQAYLVSHLKERMRIEQASKAKTAAAAKAASPPAPALSQPAQTSSASPAQLPTAARAGSPKAQTAPSAAPGSGAAPASQPAPPAASPPPSAPSAVSANVSAPAVVSPAAASTATAADAPKPGFSASPIPNGQPASPAAPAVSSAGSPAAVTGGAEGKKKADDPLAALSALAAHPEAAGLIALIKRQQAGGGPQTARLSPAQMQLLQMANKLAAQQAAAKGKGKKKGKGKAKEKSTGGEGGAAGGSGSPLTAKAVSGPNGSGPTPSTASPSPAPAPAPVPASALAPGETSSTDAVGPSTTALPTSSAPVPTPSPIPTSSAPDPSREKTGVGGAAAATVDPSEPPADGVQTGQTGQTD